MTPAQSRAARALLAITQSELATASRLGLSTIVDFEKGRRQVSDDAIKAMQSALERGGIVFTTTGAELVARKKSAHGGFIAAFREGLGPFQESTHMGLLLTKTGLLSAAQIRAARALLRWSAQDLARESVLGINTIRRAEVAEEGTSLTAANELAIRRAFEAAGVLFIDENGSNGPGVRLRKRRRKAP